MIYFLIILDILINNYTKYTSYFFIIYLYNKPYRYYLLTGLILDFIIFKTYYFNIIILSIIYIINKIFKGLNKDSIYIYLLVNIFNYLLFIILSNLAMFNSVFNILILLGYNLIINLIFYLLSYSVHIKLK